MRRLLVPLALAITLVPVCAFAQDKPKVSLSTWEQAANGTGVRFEPLPTMTEADAGDVPFVDETQKGLFQYRIDLSDVRWADDCRCFRYYQIVVRRVATGAITRHKFKALPSGTFDD